MKKGKHLPGRFPVVRWIDLNPYLADRHFSVLVEEFMKRLPD